MVRASRFDQPGIQRMRSLRRLTPAIYGHDFTFTLQFEQAMESLHCKLPSSRVLVASIPVIYDRWEIGRTSDAAISGWQFFGICH
jgi:hypothetical protein